MQEQGGSILPTRALVHLNWQSRGGGCSGKDREDGKLSFEQGQGDSIGRTEDGGWSGKHGSSILLKTNQSSLRKNREGLNFPVGIENMQREYRSLPICVKTNRVKPSLVCIEKGQEEIEPSCWY